MAHATSQGLSQEVGPLINLAQLCLPALEKRRVTPAYLENYATKTRAMEEIVAASGGKNSDKKQLTSGEAAARDLLLSDVRRVQGGVKHTYKRGSPQWKEFFVGEYFNHSTALLNKWAEGIKAAWPKYKDHLFEKSGLIQADMDSLISNAALLKDVDTTQESARRFDAPEATAAAQKAMAEVEAIADYIYVAATAEYARDPVKLGEFEAIKPLRYAVERKPKPPDNPTPPPASPQA